MLAQKKIHAVPGSERSPLPDAVIVGEVDPNERIAITLKLRERPSTKDIRSRAREIGATSIADRRYLTHEEFAAQHGASPEDLSKVEAFAHEYGLTIVELSVAKRSVKLTGTAEALGTAFAVKLANYEARKVRYRGRTGPVYVPSELTEIVVSVMGLDNRPVAKPHSRRREAGIGAAEAIGGRNAVLDGSLSAPDVARLYDFPKSLDGAGQCIALIELNDIDLNTNAVTGTGFNASDLKTYFANLQIPLPQVIALSVDGGANTPGRDTSADREVTLDIEVAGAVAPGAKIAVYFSPNTERGFSDAVSHAIHDTANSPSIISISWGGSEDSATKQYRDAMDTTIASAGLLGITVCVATGDNGSADMVPQGCISPSDPNPPIPWDGVPHVDFPASSPHSLACGGTRLEGSGATIASEIVWNEGCGGGGGGVSNIFSRPDYQAGISLPTSPTGFNGRGLPDVAGNADPQTGYRVFVGGNPDVIGGTSAVAPLWAALIALINQGRVKAGGKTVGFLNPVIYNNSGIISRAFHDIVVGNNDLTGALNGVYSAAPGWDACTGLGSPIGTQLFSALVGANTSNSTPVQATGNSSQINVSLDAKAELLKQYFSVTSKLIDVLSTSPKS